jgi:hypothetical protein
VWGFCMRKNLFPFFCFPFQHGTNCVQFGFVFNISQNPTLGPIGKNSGIHTKLPPQERKDEGGSSERHRECRWSLLLSHFKETLTNALLSI